MVAIYSTFLQRGYDQLIHDVALQNLPVVFALDRAGLVGADGATHAGTYDIAYLRCIPNMMVMTPADENECRQMLTTAFQQDCPTAVRYPRGAGAGVATEAAADRAAGGQGRDAPRGPCRAGQRVAFLAFGSMLHPALGAAEALDASVANMRFVKPLDVELVKSLAANHDYLVTVEEGSTMGGAGSAVLEALAGGRHRHSGAGAGPARPVHRSWRSGVPAVAVRPGRRRHRAFGARALRHRRGARRGRHAARGLIRTAVTRQVKAGAAHPAAGFSSHSLRGG